MAKKIVVFAFVLLVAAAVFIIWSYFLVGGFSAKYARLNSIEAEYGIDEEILVPGDAEKLTELEAKLRVFRRSLDDSADGKALKLLVDSRLDLVEMERNFLLAGQRAKNMNPFNPNCIAIEETIGQLNLGIEKARAALDKRRMFLGSYRSQAAIAGIESNQNFESGINNIISSIEIFKSNLDSYC